MGQRFSRANVDALVTGLVQGGVTWLPNTSQFWYRVTTGAGTQLVLVDAGAWSKRVVLDSEPLAIQVAAAARDSAARTPVPAPPPAPDLRSGPRLSPDGRTG